MRKLTEAGETGEGGRGGWGGFRLDTLKVPSTVGLDCLPRILGACGALRLLGPALNPLILDV